MLPSCERLTAGQGPAVKGVAPAVHVGNGAVSAPTTVGNVGPTFAEGVQVGTVVKSVV